MVSSQKKKREREKDKKELHLLHIYIMGLFIERILFTCRPLSFSFNKQILLMAAAAINLCHRTKPLVKSVWASALIPVLGSHLFTGIWVRILIGLLKCGFH